MSDKLLIYKIYHGKLKTAKYVQIDPFRKGPLQKLGRRGGGGGENSQAAGIFLAPIWWAIFLKVSSHVLYVLLAVHDFLLRVAHSLLPITFLMGRPLFHVDYINNVNVTNLKKLERWTKICVFLIGNSKYPPLNFCIVWLIERDKEMLSKSILD